MNKENKEKQTDELLKRAMEILLQYVDHEKCRFDHHGRCQAHLASMPNGKCANAEAKRLIKDFSQYLESTVEKNQTVQTDWTDREE